MPICSLAEKQESSHGSSQQLCSPQPFDWYDRAWFIRAPSILQVRNNYGFISSSVTNRQRRSCPLVGPRKAAYSSKDRFHGQHDGTSVAANQSVSAHRNDTIQQAVWVRKSFPCTGSMPQADQAKPFCFTGLVDHLPRTFLVPATVGSIMRSSSFPFGMANETGPAVWITHSHPSNACPDAQMHALHICQLVWINFFSANVNLFPAPSHLE